MGFGRLNSFLYCCCYYNFLTRLVSVFLLSIESHLRLCLVKIDCNWVLAHCNANQIRVVKRIKGSGHNVKSHQFIVEVSACAHAYLVPLSEALLTSGEREREWVKNCVVGVCVCVFKYDGTAMRGAYTTARAWNSLSLAIALTRNLNAYAWDEWCGYLCRSFRSSTSALLFIFKRICFTHTVSRKNRSIKSTFEINTVCLVRMNFRNKTHLCPFQYFASYFTIYVNDVFRLPCALFGCVVACGCFQRKCVLPFMRGKWRTTCVHAFIVLCARSLSLSLSLHGLKQKEKVCVRVMYHFLICLPPHPPLLCAFNSGIAFQNLKVPHTR